MAKKKKVAKKPAKKPAKKAAKKAPAKSAAKKAPAAKPGEFVVSTGKGSSPMEIGMDLVAKFNAGQTKEIEDLYWAPMIESIEGIGVGMGWRGKESVYSKNAWWAADHVMHGGTAEGPYVGSTGFAVRFRLDIETKSTGQREWMEEVGVYTVKDGKIIREEFMYNTGGGPSSA